MFRVFRTWRERRIVERADIDQRQWQAALDALPVLDGLDTAEQARLRELTVLFLHYKFFSAARDFEISETMKLVIALQACLPILNLGIECYDGWDSIIVYPSGFAPEHVYLDEFGVEHVVREEMSGEAWQRGPVLLSWDEALTAGELDGFNLVIHEFAHKLDMQNGEANGFPPLHHDMDPASWTQIFSSAFTDFERRCEHGEDTGIDDYAASNPAEFFAVLSEVFFERPEWLDASYPAVYAQLRLYYRQDPLRRLNHSRVRKRSARHVLLQ